MLAAPAAHTQFAWGESQAGALARLAALRWPPTSHYNPPSPENDEHTRNATPRTRTGLTLQMNAKKLEHFKTILTAQLRQLTNQVSDERAAAIESADGDAKDVVDKSQQDVNQELALQ